LGYVRYFTGYVLVRLFSFEFVFGSVLGKTYRQIRFVLVEFAFSPISNTWSVFCRDVSAASSCIDNVPCSPTDSDYDLWRSTIGMIDLYDGYLCRSDVRQSKCHTRSGHFLCKIFTMENYDYSVIMKQAKTDYASLCHTYGVSCSQGSSDIKYDQLEIFWPSI